MPLELREVTAVELRSLGLDERWLQEKIKDNPKILGIGDVEIVSREHRQPVGGRIDFLMRDEETYYEVEVMLGRLDESHIIRTIEYWDLERQRRPQMDHCAVIVAEQITSRFFNVLRLLNRAVPMIAVQLSAIRLNENEIAILPVTVLNVVEEVADDADVDPSERADRAYWASKVTAESLAVFDEIVAALQSSGLEPQITYNRHHIALGTTGRNFCWFHRRVLVGNWHIECRLDGESRQHALDELTKAGIDALAKQTRDISFNITATSYGAHTAVVMEVLKRAEVLSRN